MRIVLAHEGAPKDISTEVRAEVGDWAGWEIIWGGRIAMFDSQEPTTVLFGPVNMRICVCRAKSSNIVEPQFPWGKKSLPKSGQMCIDLPTRNVA
jgi:hypothetical protein